MPATVVKQPSTISSNKPQTTKPRAAPQAKGRRIFRRRGRARGELDSDDELEREAATDSDTDDNDISSSDSATDDSDTEPASDDVVPHDRTHLPTPRNSKSPDSIAKETTRQLIGESTSLFAASTNWSDNMEREEAEGANQVPVIDFADFNAKTAERIPTVPKSKRAKQKAKRAAKRQAAAVTSQQPPQSSLPQNRESPPKEDSTPLDNKQSAWSAVQEGSPSTYVSPARQAYQQRLETDPSYVPKIGNFWGHDDRLIDADLRSLSFWWNSQRGGRGRGRGGFRGRGGHNHGDRFHKQPEELEQDQQPDQVPPIERTWTHDGFEELKRKEEQRRAQAAARQDSTSKRGGFAGARGGAFTGSRGRGGFMRGGMLSPGGRNPMLQNRIRFVMKPEVMWTKQSEIFLFLDPAMKPRNGQGPGYRIRIPGHEGEVVRAPLGSSKLQERPAKSSRPVTSNFTVRLPYPQTNADAEKKEELVDETRQKDEEEHLVTLEERPTSITPHQAPTPLLPEIQPSASVSAQPLPSIRTQLEQITLGPAEPSPERQALTEQAVMRKPSLDLDVTQTPAKEQNTSTERPTLPPLQTTFTPPPPPQPQPIQPNPGYGAPYGYPAPLPPGIGLNPHGMPYELATGRPVYLPHPPPMYNPRPMMHSHNPSMTFVPGHMHHPSSGTPDFLAQPPHTPPVNGFIDPTTGNPIFSFPRPNARIQIRPPGDEGSKQAPPKSSTTPRASTNLRTVAPPFQPSTYSNDQSRQSNGYYTPSDASLPAYDNSNGHIPMDDGTQGMPNGMMPYPSYQQPYYYPEPYGYSQQYVDMSQHGQYDMYNMDQVPQGTVYY
ncbi:hypothetical protein BJ165DRAFT_1521223 [Panaeolus papilionaceus]|nr:hypothetical protein BJ165DRAFT_1521223 [Panaeolus papilionaceus]